MPRTIEAPPTEQRQLEQKDSIYSQQMDVLQKNICSLKLLLHGRVEDTLAIVGESEKELFARQEALKRELKAELIQELKESVRKEISSRGSTLNISADPFAPSLSTRAMNDPRAVPVHYSGLLLMAKQRITLTDNLSYYQRINGWSDVKKATILVVNLRGYAAAVLTNIHNEDSQNFGTLTAALDGSPRAALNRVQLRAKTRLREE